MFFLLVSLAATPSAQSSWQLKLDDTRSIGRATIDGKPANTELKPFLGRITLGLELKEIGEEAPRAFRVTVRGGNASLAGRSFDVESNYGEPGLREVNPPRAEQDEWPGVAAERGEALKLLRRAVGLLLKADPIVLAASHAEPCGDEARAQVLAAVAQRVAFTTSGAQSGETSFTDSQVTCGKKAGSYAIAFTLNAPVGSATYAFPFKGTVDVPPGAWRANLALSSTKNIKVEIHTHRANVIVSQVISSTISKQ